MSAAAGCDVVLHNGRVLTQTTPATAVVVRNGRIVVVGDSADLLRLGDSRMKRIDLAGRTLVPGFNDAHAHIWKIGHLLTTMLDLRRVTAIPELVDAAARFAERLPPDRWLLGRGYNEALLDEGRAPTRRDLDRVSTDRPVVLTRTCGHLYAANSVALARAGIDAATAAPPGGVIGRDERGEPTGLLHETAMGLVNRVMPAPTASDYEAMIAAALGHQLSLGITSSSDCGDRKSVV